MLVGRSIHRPRVTWDPECDHIILSYMGRVRKIPRTSMVELGALPERLLARTYTWEAELMARFADAADEYARQRFSPEIYGQYCRSIYNAHGTR